MSEVLNWIKGETGDATSASSPNDGTPAPQSPTEGLVVGAFPVVAPRADAGVWTPVLIRSLDQFEINSASRVAAFLAQVSVESAAFTTLEENLHYSAARLFAVWPSHFSSVDAAEPYAMNPEKLANYVYANRMGNGDEASGDGWLYRGGGLIQLTGKANYEAFAKEAALSVSDAANYVRTAAGAAESAAWFWSVHNLNGLADEWEITAITHTVNGGLNGAAQRLALANAALKAIEPTT
jgi:putative chitinase